MSVTSVKNHFNRPFSWSSLGPDVRDEEYAGGRTQWGALFTFRKQSRGPVLDLSRLSKLCGRAYQTASRRI
jgi:hypothetical protein